VQLMYTNVDTMLDRRGTGDGTDTKRWDTRKEMG